MGRFISPEPEARCLYFHPGGSGYRAFFLAEVRTLKDARFLEDLFRTVGGFAEVVHLASGPVMSFAVQLDPATTDMDVFHKIERSLVSRFPFTVVEREVTDVTLKLARTLCADAEGEVAELPECEICGAEDPFPTRETLVWADEARDPEHLAFCRRCAVRHAHPDVATHALALLARAGRGRLPADVPVVLMREIGDLQAEPEALPLAATG
jgi:hypothetical protein